MPTHLLLVLLLVAGCGGGADTVSTGQGEPAVSLAVEYRADEGAPMQSWTLTCDPVGGDHPDAEAACRDLAAQREPFAPIPADAICTQQYGGPQTATVRGTYRGDAVDIALSRTDGCRIAQWDRLGALLPSGS